MGWALSAALTPFLQRAYGWVGTLLWAQGFPPIGIVATPMRHIALVIGGALVVPMLMAEAAAGRGAQALGRLVLAAGGVLAAPYLMTWLWRLNTALIATIARTAGGAPLPAPSIGRGLIDLMVFGIPELLMLVFLAALLIARLAALLLLSAVSPLAFLLGVHRLFSRLPLSWFWQAAAWSILPAVEAYLLATVRSLAGETSLAVPASDMLLALALLYFMVRLPFSLLAAGRRLTAP